MRSKLVSNTPINNLCKLDPRQVVEWLLEHGANVDVRDKSLRTPLFHAIISKNLELVKMLIEKRTSVTLTGTRIIHPILWCKLVLLQIPWPI